MNNLRRKQRDRKIFYLHTVVGLTYKEIRSTHPEFDLSDGSFSRIIKEVRQERKGANR